MRATTRQQVMPTVAAACQLTSRLPCQYIDILLSFLVTVEGRKGRRARGAGIWGMPGVHDSNTCHACSGCAEGSRDDLLTSYLLPAAGWGDLSQQVLLYGSILELPKLEDAKWMSLIFSLWHGSTQACRFSVGPCFPLTLPVCQLQMGSSVQVC